VVITGPATLMITLKLIAQLWRREKENQNAAVIADKAGKLYDHILRIEESMSRARSQLETVTRSMDEAYNRLTDGRGNAIKRINELKQLGAKVSKTLPASLEGSLDDDEQDAVDEDK
jgi:DNA recombination protein RmuC